VNPTPHQAFYQKSLGELDGSHQDAAAKRMREEEAKTMMQVMTFPLFSCPPLTILSIFPSPAVEPEVHTPLDPRP